MNLTLHPSHMTLSLLAQTVGIFNMTTALCSLKHHTSPVLCFSDSKWTRQQRISVLQSYNSTSVKSQHYTGVQTELNTETTFNSTDTQKAFKISFRGGRNNFQL